MDAPNSPWQNLVKDPKVLPTVGGLLVFGVLTLIYGRFYNNIGVDPRDIGLDYIATLVKSVQLLVGVVGYSVTVVAVLYIGTVIIANIFTTLMRKPAMFNLGAMRSSIPGQILTAFLLTVVMLLFVADQAYKDAEQVREGRPVSYIHIGPFLLEAPVRADPAFVEPITATGSTPSESLTPSGSPSTKSSDPAKDTTAIEALRGRMLIYLGQANSILMLYDSTTGQAIHLPASQVVLRVAHCQDKQSPSPGCTNAY